jgi:hypothetical protein
MYSKEVLADCKREGLIMSKLRDHYFSHDVNASRDVKILKMRDSYGARGYGLFWEIIEYLFSSGGKPELNYKMVSLAIGEDVRTVKPFLIACIDDFQLFESDGKTFWSNRLLSDIDRIVETSQRNSRAAQIRYAKNKDNSLQSLEFTNDNIKIDECGCTANEEQLHCERTAIDKIYKKDKTNIGEAKGKVANATSQTIRFNKPKIEEVREYCIERENHIEAQRFIDYYEANGWKVGRNPMKDWKAAVRTWERNTSFTSLAMKEPYDPHKELRLRNEC